MATNIIISGTGTAIKVSPADLKTVKVTPVIGSVPSSISVDLITGGDVFAESIFNIGPLNVLGTSTFQGQTTFNGETTFSGPQTKVNNLHAASLYFGSASPSSESTIGLSNLYPNEPADLSITSNGNVTVYLDSDSNETGQKFRVMDPSTAERFSVDDSGVVKFNNQYSFPSADGQADQILKTDGAGNLSWVNEYSYSPPPPASSITVDDIEAPIITSPEDIELRLDTDNTGTAKFFITNTAGTTLMSVNETGTVTFLEKPFASNVIELDDTPANYGTAGQVLATNATADGTEWVSVSSDLVDDTTPQLGGNLDVNGSKIVSSSNGDVIIEPDGTGDIILSAGEIVLSDNTQNMKIQVNSTGIDFHSDLTGDVLRLSSATNRVDVLQPLSLGGHATQSKEKLGVKVVNNHTGIVCENSSNIEKFKFEVDGSGQGVTTISDYLTISGQLTVDDGVNPFTLPASDGTSGQVLTTDGAGATSWQTVSGGGGDLVDDTTPQLGGNLDTNTFDIAFQDNDKAIFGTGSDLQIYHDGNDSFITDAGTGDLKVRASTIKIEDADGSPTHMQISNSQLTLNSGNGLINIGNNKIGNGVDEEYVKIDGINNLVSINVENIPYLTVGDNNVLGDGYVRVDGKLQMGTAYEFPVADGTSGQVLQTDGAGNTSWVSPSYPTTTISASTTLSSSHEQKMLLCDSATAMTLTINTGMTADTEILVYQAGTGGVSISAGTGVTINNTASFAEETAEQYAIIGLKKLGTSEVWVITGERKLA